METYTLDEETATRVLQQIVDEFGPEYKVETGSGWVYKNVDTNEPVCIVGQLLARTGFDMSLFGGFPSLNSTNISNVFFRLEKLIGKEINVSNKLIRALSDAQYHQDKGDTWQKAFEAFKAKLEMLNRDL